MSQESNPLRLLPGVDALLNDGRLAEVRNQFGSTMVGDAIRSALATLRADLQSQLADQTITSQVWSRDGLTQQLIEQVLADLAHSAQRGLRPIINATGVILHTNLGRAVLSESAQQAMLAASGYCNLEFDISTGERGRRGGSVEDRWCQLTGSESALMVNNAAAATVLALRALGAGREIIVSRGQLIEIGGSFRLPDIFTEAGVTLREVGTTNRTRLADYKNAIGPNTAGILLVHPSNYKIMGFTESVELDELVPLAREHGLCLIDDIGSGSLIALPHYPQATLIQDRVRQQPDVVIFSGDKLVGGPQSGVLLGRKEIINRLRKHPLTRAFRCDKMTYAGMEATLQSYQTGRALGEIPTLAMLAISVDELRTSAQEILAEWSAFTNDQPFVLIDSAATMGGGSLPGDTLPSVAVALEAKKLAERPIAQITSLSELSKRLRTGSPSIVGRIESDG